MTLTSKWYVQLYRDRGRSVGSTAAVEVALVSFEGDLRRYFDTQFHLNTPKKRAVCWPIHFYSTKDLGMHGLEADQLGIVWAALLAL